MHKEQTHCLQIPHTLFLQKSYALIHYKLPIETEI